METEVTNMQPTEQPCKKQWLSKTLKVVGKVMLVLVETVLVLAIALYGVLFILAKGPSHTARDIFVMSVRETSAMGFLANMFFTPEEIAAGDKPMSKKNSQPDRQPANNIAGGELERLKRIFGDM